MIPFFGFRLMVGMGLLMLAISWLGNLLRLRGRLETTRWFLWGTFLSFPTGFIAILTGWYTAEVGRQPWVVYGMLRTKDAVTPSLVTGDVLVLADRLRPGVRRVRLVRDVLHLQAAARGADRRGDGDSERDAQPARWPSPMTLRAPRAANLRRER